ncbi:hypothetical protein AB1A81_12870 [Bdellovibrio bacteriovorus]|uniref:C-type lysozyme inhibitor domain-containing protein n=1 Tax=Bdellovibrio bacteriovorus (strain ATCC 15356 / DSM 50701 / NCIMB 9529 / HD100) TaxID=264462 RepID=Q6MJH3_BDEBA|nr:hypothetical protein [Bdellovibrio bacteriovorus]CAE80587.1 hypothetical protein predicted by Glimmer/Critica [Bdellovibrio bacteriovorus HD100]
MKTFKRALTAIVLSLAPFVNAHAAVCTITTSETPFKASKEQPDREYATLEKGSANGVDFYLRAAHGVVRLEAWKSGKLVVSTFAQEGAQSPYGDALNLAIQTPAGPVEAQCEGFNALLGY